MTNIQDQLTEPVVIDDEGVTVDGKTLLVEKNSVSVEQDREEGVALVTLTLITDNLTIDLDSDRVREQVTVRGRRES